MTFEEKLKNSEILDDGYIEKGKEVKNKKNRYIGIILALLLAAYTIYINISKYQYLAHIIETDSHQLDDTLLIISFIAIGLKLILSFIIAF
ncbi:MAG: hypothetical protein K6B64_06100, partial [Acholeplasmatales bacterium]|nr:hypothetical protein [Acholeplasmatales bacterium]